MVKVSPGAGGACGHCQVHITHHSKTVVSLISLRRMCFFLFPQTMALVGGGPFHIWNLRNTMSSIGSKILSCRNGVSLMFVVPKLVVCRF